MKPKLTERFSTTQVAGVLTMLLTIYNAVAQISGMSALIVTPETVTLIASLLSPIAPSIYMMWRRTKKDDSLKFGFLKQIDLPQVVASVEQIERIRNRHRINK